jgi:hypothetical protein
VPFIPDVNCNTTLTITADTDTKGVVHAEFTPPCTGNYTLIAEHSQLVNSAADQAVVISDTIESR